MIRKLGNLFKEKKLGVHLALVTSIAIAVVVIAISLAYLDLSTKLDVRHKMEKENLKSTISHIIIKNNNKEISRGDFKDFGEVTGILMKNKLIQQVAIYSKAKKSFVWSTNKNIIGKDMDPQKYLSATKNSILIPTDTHLIIMTYPEPPGLDIDKLLNISKIAVLFVLTLGLIFIALIAQSIVKPLVKLSQQANFIAKGNFDNTLPRTEYKEINTLVNSLNIMSYELKKIYSSLEDKVKQRTQEINNKNQELEKVYLELKDTQSMMVHSEKMRSLGEMVSGITHEINNPVNFIHGNLTHLKNYSKDLIDIIEKYKELSSKLPDTDRKEIEELLEELDYSYLKEDLPKLIGSCQEGTERTRNIVMDLKNFSRMEEMLVSEINIEKEIHTALNILANKYKDVVEIHEEFSHIPTIEAYGGQLNQVFVNILDNAIGAIKSVKKTGNIYIRTKQDGHNIVIEFQDDGRGMTEEQKLKIFEPFFTTKPIGEGTGLGMSISYKVISAHKGKIDVKTKLNEGTTIILTLPVKMGKTA